MAEAATNQDNPKEDMPPCGNFTWTFYKFATVKGYVTVRRYGEGSGYYSEEAAFRRITTPSAARCYNTQGSTYMPQKAVSRMLCLENLIHETTVTQLRQWLAEAAFEDGRATAGGDARKVKNNEQVSGDPAHRDPGLTPMQDRVLDLLWEHEGFYAAAQPKIIHPPLFSRYTPGMSYGTHMDNALMGDMRVDLSLTIFLSDPSTYDGGELVIDFPAGPHALKLAAGSAVLYPTTALHRVAEVTRGERLAVVTWVRSLVRDPAEREILLDLKTALRHLSSQVGKTPEVDLLNKSYTNLLRRWIED